MCHCGIAMKNMDNCFIVRVMMKRSRDIFMRRSIGSVMFDGRGGMFERRFCFLIMSDNFGVQVVPSVICGVGMRRMRG